MLQLILTSFIMAMALSLPLATTPLTLGFWVLCIALMMAAWLSTLTLSWFSMILFVIYVSGMLVMFAYCVAITPNYTIPNKLLLPASLMLAMASIITLANTPQQIQYFSQDTLPPMQQFMFQPTQSPVLVFLVILLFLAMVLAVKISDRNQGPLRPFN
uniref:NADH dehydrogenase subunit 6 n=1 Tax=Paralvinella sulfincola TaxID=644278 RepID=G8XXM8_9ANNE|nr:NADH dehydrogenase subunit 6 [Paralvinella sulfincola]